MLTKTEHQIDTFIIEQAIQNCPQNIFKYPINQPTGNFFYDPWELKPEFQNTEWEIIYNSLLGDKGEARIITLESGNNYYSHADIDDRWHLSLDGNQSYLIDLSTLKMVETHRDGIWYSMDAGQLHTAANFGQIPRRQLVVRKLLTRNILKNPIQLSITKIKDAFDYRYQFDHKVSPWLNFANKQGLITDFHYSNDIVFLTIEEDCLKELTSLLGDYFGAKIL